MLPNILQITVFWLVQTSALLVFTVPFRWPLAGLWAVSHFLRAIGALPGACLIAAIGLESALAWLSRRGMLMVMGAVARRISPPALIAALIIGYSGYRTYYDYFEVYVRAPLTGYWLEQQNVALANTVNAWAGPLWLQDQLINDNAALRFLSARVAQGQVNTFHSEPERATLQQAGPVSGLILLDPNHAWGALRSALPATPVTLQISEGALAQGDLDPQPHRAFIALTVQPDTRIDATPRVFVPGVELRSAEWISATATTPHPVLMLRWRLRQPAREDYGVFVHWLRNGQMLAQSDHSPGLGYWAMPEWRIGDTFIDDHMFDIPDGAQPGDEIRVGLYQRSDGQRLRVVEPASEWVIIPPPR